MNLVIINSFPVRDLRDHDSEADGEKKDPEEAAAALSVFVGRRAKAGDVHLGDKKEGRNVWFAHRSIMSG
jgi:hypothetical protein